MFHLICLLRSDPYCLRDRVLFHDCLFLIAVPPPLLLQLLLKKQRKQVKVQVSDTTMSNEDILPVHKKNWSLPDYLFKTPYNC
jgi:hypothetical protein